MRPAKSRQNVRLIESPEDTFVSVKLKLAPVEERVLPRALNVIDLVPELPLVSAYRDPDVSRIKTTVSRGLVPFLGLAVVMDVSQLGFKNTIQPISQWSPLVVHFGGDRLALEDMHMVTHILRLMASDRAL